MVEQQVTFIMHNDGTMSMEPSHRVALLKMLSRLGIKSSKMGATIAYTLGSYSGSYTIQYSGISYYTRNSQTFSVPPTQSMIKSEPKVSTSKIPKKGDDNTKASWKRTKEKHSRR